MDVRSRGVNVVLSVDAVVPPLTGIGRYAFELASRLPRTEGIDELSLFDAGHWVNDRVALLDRAQRPAEDGVGQRPIHRKRKWPRWVRRRLGPIYWRHALRGRVFHGPNYFLPLEADKGVITVHDLSVFVYPQLHPAARLQQFELHFERSLKQAHHLITDSLAIRNDVMARYDWPASRITSVPLGVADLFAPRSPAQCAPILARYGLTMGGYTLCVSTLEPRKNIDKLLAAFDALPSAVKQRFPLVLIGAPGWENSTLHSEMSRALRSGWLVHLGYVPEDDLPTLYAGARLFAFPSIYEGFGLPVLEAMATGTPVLTSNRSSLAEVAADAAILVDPADIGALTASLRRGLEDDIWRREAIVRGLARAAQHSWQRCVEATAAVYRQVGAA